MGKTECVLIALKIKPKEQTVKEKIDKTQQNRKCRLCGDRDKMINHIISECSKLTQKEYQPRHDCVRKGIHWELCRKLKFDHTNKWYTQYFVFYFSGCCPHLYCCYL